jgi:sec-independent protein translocase protein TatC
VTQAPPKDPETRMTLLEHLEELRSRLWKAVIAIVILAIGSIYFSRDLFWFLMRPVLAALPESQRALVYTSGIEEINVFLKVGLYAGVFLGAPVILYQVWQFVAPGLLPTERKMVLPFVLGGTFFFLGGATFCYLGVLPTMFSFLLKPSETMDVRDRLVAATNAADDSARLVALGRASDAQAMIEDARRKLEAPGDGHVDPFSDHPDTSETKERIKRLSSRLDLAAALARDDASRGAVARAVTLRSQAADLAERGETASAAKALEDCAAAIAESTKRSAGEAAGATFTTLWGLDKDVAAANALVTQKEFTRPMLTMREQLGLVLFMELAFGVVFELPLIMGLLAALGILKAAWIAKYQRHAIVLCVIIAAIITPTGDAVNLTIMAAPMIGCFYLGLLFVWILGKRRAAKQAEDERALAVPGE